MSNPDTGSIPLLRYGMLAVTAPFRRGGRLPAATLRREVRPDPEHLARYARVCGFDQGDAMPPTFPHVLAFGDTLELFARPDFPYPAVGLVHVRIRIEQHRPIGRTEPLTLRTRLGEQTEHRRGQRFDVLLEALVEDTVVWRSTSSYLHLRSANGGSGGALRPPDGTPPTLEHRAVRPTARWRIGPDIGRRYAAVSGDPNPIHLHPIGALLGGRRRPIAHGMWLAARCVAALANRLPPAYVLVVDFRRPVALPSRLGFAAWPARDDADGPTDGWDFQLRDLSTPERSAERSAGSARVRLTGSVRSLDGTAGAATDRLD